MAGVTKQSLSAGATKDMAASYQTIGWNADGAVIEALACVQPTEDLAAIQAVVQTIYLPWIDEAARHLQSQVDAAAYPGGFAANQPRMETHSGECIVFVDGLRFDLAKSLEALLRHKGFTVELESAWAALPSVTATAKPAVTPVRYLIRGQDVNADFEPSRMRSRLSDGDSPILSWPDGFD